MSTEALTLTSLLKSKDRRPSYCSPRLQPHPVSIVDELANSIEPEHAAAKKNAAERSIVVPCPTTILSPYEHVTRQQGKNIRAKFITAFNEYLGVSLPASEKVQRIVGELHNASLLIDDIEDGATQRRGEPVAHLVFGVPLTINCANQVYFVALAETLQLIPRPEAAQPVALILATAQAHGELTEAFAKELQELHIGQGLDIYWRDTFQCPTLDEYQSMVQQKTGGLFRLAVRLLMAVARVERECSAPQSDMPPAKEAAKKAARLPLDAPTETQLIALVDLFGFYFQVLDDYLNLRSDEYHASKSYCEDLTEGKFSFLTIHCVRSQLAAKGDSALLHILRTRPTEVDVKRGCVAMMQEAGSFDFCLATLRTIEAEIRSSMERLGRNPALTACLELLVGMLAKSTEAK